MDILRNPLWFIPAALFVLHQVLQYGFHVSIPFADSYLDPLLGTPVLIGLHRVESRYLFGAKPFGWGYLAVIAVVFALVSELLFPYLSDAFTADWGDVVAIGLGAVYYGVFLRAG